MLLTGFVSGSDNDFGAIALSRILMPMGVIMMLAGLIGVQQNQSARAAVDSADYARQQLELAALSSGVQAMKAKLN